MFAAPRWQGAGLSLPSSSPAWSPSASSALVRQRHRSRKTAATASGRNDDIMTLVRSLDRGNVWAVGRFDALTSQANLPSSVASQLPPITWFAVSGHVNGGLLGDVRMRDPRRGVGQSVPGRRPRHHRARQNCRRARIPSSKLSLRSIQAQWVGQDRRGLVRAARGNPRSPRPAVPVSARPLTLDRCKSPLIAGFSRLARKRTRLYSRNNT